MVRIIVEKYYLPNNGCPLDGRKDTNLDSNTSTFPRMFARPFGRSSRRGRRLLLLPLVLLLLLLIAAVGSTVAFEVRYGSYVHPGVQVLGENLGGMERQQAIAAVASRAQTTMQRPVEFRLVNTTERVSASELGLGVDAVRTVDRAFEVGRTGGAFSKWTARYQVWRDGKRVAPVVEFNADAARKALSWMAASVNRPVRDGKLALTAQGPIIRPSQVGYKLDAAATESRLPSSLETLHAQDRPVATVIHTIQPAVREAQLTSARDAIVATSKRPLKLSFQGRIWSMAPERVRPLIRLTGEGASVQPALQAAPLLLWAQQVSADINRPPRNARIDVQPGAVRLKPAQVGYETQLEATVERIQGAAFASAAPIPVGVHVVRPAIGDADLQPEVRGAHALVSRPLRLQYADREWTLSPAQLTALLRWKGNDPNRTPYLAPEPSEAWVRGVAEEIDTSPRDARIDVQDGLARVLAEAPGTRMDIQNTLAAVQRALDDPRGVVAITAVRVPASVSATDLQAAAARANRLIGSPVLVAHQGQTWTIDTSTLQNWLYWTGEGKEVTPALDEEQVYDFARKIAYEVYQEPQSAYMELEPGGLPELVPEVMGVDVDVDRTAEVIRTLAASENREGAVTAFSVAPAVSAADLQDDFDQIAAWSSDRFYLSMDDDHTWWLDREDIADVTFWNNAGGVEIEPYLDVATMEQHIRRWVKAPPKTVIDYETTAANAVEALERGDRSVALEYRVIKDKQDVPRHVADLAHWKGKFPDKWIDLNLTTQTIAAYEGKKQTKISLITSGRPELATPTGVYSVMDKLSPYTFISPWPKGHKWWYPTAEANFALRFRYGGLYIHDAPWRTQYGPGTNGSGRSGEASTGSHGCVNVPYDMMARLFSWSEVGTPIIIHK